MLLPVGALPDDPLAASRHFHSDVLPALIIALDAAAGHATLVFGPADHRHEDWRRAVVTTLARAHAPLRINAIAGDDHAGIAATADYVAGAPGLTGQYLVVEGQGAALGGIARTAPA